MSEKPMWRGISGVCRWLLVPLVMSSYALPALALDILVTNDDGYQAKGIQVLADTLEAAGHNVLLVAPFENQSGTGGKFNAHFGEPTSYTEFAPGRYYVPGSPVDAALMGLYIIGPEQGLFGDDNRPDLVVSGINRGGNAGILTNHSGTVAAAMRGVREGVPSIAVSAGMDISEASQGFPSTDEAYPKIANLVVKMINTLDKKNGDRERLLPLGMGLNVNWPVALPEGQEEPLGIRFTRITNTTVFNLGPVRQDDGSIIIHMLPNNDLLEDDPSTAEGNLFIEGYVTISTMDANIEARRVKRDLTQVRLDGLNLQ